MGSTVETPGTNYTWANSTFAWDDFTAQAKTWAAAHHSAFSRSDDQSMAFEENRASGIAPDTADGFTMADTLAPVVVWVRDTAEGFTASDAAPVHAVGHNPDEAFEVSGRFLRTSKAVIADVEIRNEALTEAAFTRLLETRAPAGYGPFRELVPGDYEYENAKVWLRVDARDAPQDDLSVTVGKLTVDVPDITDRGTDSISNTGTTITFERTFNVAPEVTVTPTGSTLSLPLVTAITTTTFTVELYDPASPATKIAGDITWTAIGY